MFFFQFNSSRSIFLFKTEADGDKLKMPLRERSYLQCITDGKCEQIHRMQRPPRWKIYGFVSVGAEDYTNTQFSGFVLTR